MDIRIEDRAVSGRSVRDCGCLSGRLYSADGKELLRAHLARRFWHATTLLPNTSGIRTSPMVTGSATTT